MYQKEVFNLVTRLAMFLTLDYIIFQSYHFRQSKLLILFRLACI